ncbi:helix-turn-helix domain-containing protein [Marinobacterium stanieri]|uniref:helix-turn-helix domain-containing protein n=1 Tax=Marinobacterium stanieri TaxID=49186 RepID=UPI000306E421|nr:helix-turn-helix domain-containing protein [Marinobacterium stanieri]
MHRLSMNVERKQTHHQLDDASRQAAAQPWLDLEMHQLSPGHYQGACATLTLDGMHLVHEHQNQAVHKSGVTQGNLCALSIAKTVSPGMRFSQFLNPMDSWLYFLPKDAELDIRVMPASETFYLCLDQDWLLRGAQILKQHEGAKHPAGPQAFHSRYTARLMADFNALIHHSSSARLMPSDNCARLLRDSVVIALSQATAIDTGVCRSVRAGWRAQRLVSTARDYMDACLQVGQVPSITDICATTGVSERTLQYAFRSTMQLTPIAYLRTLRLNRVRAELLIALPAHTTVTRVAMRWGFVHLGEFSQEYKRLFGERPSETLVQRPD